MSICARGVLPVPDLDATLVAYELLPVLAPIFVGIFLRQEGIAI
jgi:hypothetical protein